MCVSGFLTRVNGFYHGNHPLSPSILQIVLQDTQTSGNIIFQLWRAQTKRYELHQLGTTPKITLYKSYLVESSLVLTMNSPEKSTLDLIRKEYFWKFSRIRLRQCKELSD